MSEKKKVVSSNLYKEALEKRSMDMLRREAAQMERKRRAEQAEAAKREKFRIRQLQDIDSKRAEVAMYTEELERARKAVSGDVSGMLGYVFLGFFALVVVITVILRIRGMPVRTSLIAMFIALAVLMISLILQIRAMEVEKNVEKYTALLMKAERELQALEREHRRQ